MRPHDQLATVSKEWLAATLGTNEPFPWQAELLVRFRHGHVPRALDIPTGLGKTAVMAIWLVARACGAALPRRLVYVVDRRAVVDQATKVAERLRKIVDDTPDLKSRLLTAPASSLPISTLRGQFTDNQEWLADPASPAIIIGTIDMVGSRLLFEGYGTSRRMRPFHAGLLGTDTLVVLDEAHLSPAFEALVASIAHPDGPLRVRGPAEPDIVPPLRFISLSATGRTTADTFTLTAADRRHRTVRRRLDARKRLILRKPADVGERPLAQLLANEAWDLAGRGARPCRCVVFCDRRRDAVALHDALRDRAAGIDIDKELLVGERRVYERHVAASWLEKNGFFAGDRATPTKPALLIATSAGEVGVDLDADHMVADVVPWERMVQRLGRVNRRGDGDATVVVVPTLPDKETKLALEKAAQRAHAATKRPAEEADETNGPALKPSELKLVQRYKLREAALDALHRLPRCEGGGLDASPGALESLKQRANEDSDLAQLLAQASTPAPLHPALTPALVEAWSMTALPEHTGRPEVQPWVRGWVDDDPQTTIVWRRHLPVRRNGTALDDDDVARFFEAAPPHLLEGLETESHRAIDWLAKRLSAIAKGPEESAGDTASDERPSDREENPAESDVPGGSEGHPLRRDAVVAFVISPQGEVSSIRRDALTQNSRARREIAGKLYSATLVVDVRLGGLAETGLLDDDYAAAKDVGDLPGVLPFRVRTVTPGTAGAIQADGWREELRLDLDLDDEERPTRSLVVESDPHAPATTEDGRSIATRRQRLDEHEECAERHARDIGERLALPPEWVNVLALAARIHDEGKKAARWQRAFHAPPGGPWAKTTGRPNVHLLDGYRHELGSLLYAERDPRLAALDDASRDLCLHLVAAHHGYARPLLRTDGCDEAPPSVLTACAGAVAMRFFRLQQRWGAWGLAWWETLLRAADQRASRENDEREPDHG